VRGSNYEGITCGTTEATKAKPLVWYPEETFAAIIRQDIETFAGQKNTLSESKRPGLCVSNCPAVGATLGQGTALCGQLGCHVHTATSNMFYRCLGNQTMYQSMRTKTQTFEKQVH
jgi:hypothetical protein